MQVKGHLVQNYCLHTHRTDCSPWTTKVVGNKKVWMLHDVVILSI